MKKIVFIISSLGSGGAERVIINLANYLSDAHQVYILTFSNKNSFYKLNTSIIHAKLNLFNKSTSIFNGINNNIERIKILRAEIRLISPDVVISFLTQTNIITIVSLLGIKMKIIISERSIFNTENNSIFWRVLRRFTYPLSNMLVLLTKDENKNYNFVKNKTIIPNFIDINELSPEMEKEKIILAVGRLHPIKQFDKLIEIYSKLDTSYKLFIVGEGSERLKLKSLIEKLKLQNRVILLGQKKDVYQYYKRADIFVLTSKHEAFPNVLLEAMYFGCSIVSFDCDYGPRNIIKDGYSGFLAKDEQEFLEKLRILLKNEDIKNKFIKNANFRIQSFDKIQILNKWKAILDD